MNKNRPKSLDRLKITSDQRILIDEEDVTETYFRLHEIGTGKQKPHLDDKKIRSLCASIEYCCKLSELHSSNLEVDVLMQDGMSSPKVRHLLNNICSHPQVFDKKIYFEIGTASGSTYVAANKSSNIFKSYACDLWAEEKNGENGEDNFLNNCEKYLERHPDMLFSQDCFSIDKSKFKDKVNIYFFDGPHEVEDHKNALVYFQDVFDDYVVAIIDDWNDERVQLGTMLGLNNIDFEIMYWNYLPAKFTMAPFGSTIIPRFGLPLVDDRFGDVSTWWNGIMIVILKKIKNDEETYVSEWLNENG